MMKGIALIIFLVTSAFSALAQIDIPARFPGGNNGYDNYLAQNLEYPESALDAEADRTVKVIIDIDSIGRASIQEFVYANSGLGFEDEVSRFIGGMPRWSPAIYNGVISTSQVILTFDFKFSHEQEEEIETYNITYHETSDIPPFYAFGHDSLETRFAFYLKDTLKLKNIRGQITMGFIIDTLGRILNLSMLENTSDISDRNIMYAFQKIGGWYPGLLKGRKVSVETKVILLLD